MRSVTVLKLKVVCVHDEALDEIGQLCRKARNAGAMDWLLRKHGKPESDRQSKRLIARKDAEDKPKSESTKLYHAMAEAVPELGSQVLAVLASSLDSYLGAKVDWRRGVGDNGKMPRRRDAIMRHEDRPPYFTTLEIPVHNKQVKIAFGDKLFINALSLTKQQKELPLEIRLQGVPTGIKQFVQELADGRRKLPVSKLVRKEDGWFWHVALQFETQPRSDVEATLTPVLGAENEQGNPLPNFMRLMLPNGRDWGIGAGRYLLAQTERYITVRKAIGWRYRQRLGAGHGRQKVDEAMRRRRQQEQNMRAEVRRQAIADVVRQCVRQNVGVLHYREPSLPLRNKSWFAANGLEWDWTRFEADLCNACARQEIEVRTKLWRVKDVA